jgi:site-specific DNA-methyltransferase (adenine-specific)/adenine-specific DNA-methyltransferase
MPTLNWIGKKAVVNHHRQVPFHLLKDVPELSVGETGTGNLLVEGDNLLALKALLPYYAGQVKCIYIDPPYNTGNENWIYNDSLNSQEIKTWLNSAVGKEGEDLSRHDKWLCMMYPRLSLLRQLLRDDGVIFVSIDDNEAFYLRLLLDEIFGAQNFVQAIIWKNKYGPGAMTKGFGNVHEYILCYSRNPIVSIEAPLSEEEALRYKGRDSKYAVRGGYITQPLATRSKDARPNLVYPINYKGEEIWPDKQWIWAKERMNGALANDEIVFRKSKGKWSVRFKQYLRDENGQIRKAKPISIMTGPFNQDGTWEIESIFGSKLFPNPKPVALIKFLASMVINGKEDKNGLYLDSFGGSGTTGHAIVELNKEDGGNRRFIVVEMDTNICRNVTAERLRRVCTGYKKADGLEIEGLGDGFRYAALDDPLFDERGNIRNTVSFADLARHVYFTETGEPLSGQVKATSPLIGKCNGIAVYLLYNGILKDKTPNGGNVLTLNTLAHLPKHDGPKVVYGTACRLAAERLRRESIVFKQLPYRLKVDAP